jgi:hypothetical protein
LLRRIKNGKCTPFLGAAVNYEILPLGKDIAKEWAVKYRFPLKEGREDLAKVAQFMAIQSDQKGTKELIIEMLESPMKTLNFDDVDEPLNVLAKLPFPVYITTNYDDLLFKSIEHQGRTPRHEICRWNKTLQAAKPRDATPQTTSDKSSKDNGTSSAIGGAEGEREASAFATDKRPVIYHLHGHNTQPESVVLTEDDYYDFLVNMSKNFPTFLPPRIQEAMGSTLLFVGYSLADINFRVLFRGLIENLPTALAEGSIAVQLPLKRKEAQEYVTQYFLKFAPNKEIKVYWGKAREFAKELRERWERYSARE